MRIKINSGQVAKYLSLLEDEEDPCYFLNFHPHHPSFTKCMPLSAIARAAMSIASKAQQHPWSASQKGPPTLASVAEIGVVVKRSGEGIKYEGEREESLLTLVPAELLSSLLAILVI
jgi:hypothetical protein